MKTSVFAVVVLLAIVTICSAYRYEKRASAIRTVSSGDVDFVIYPNAIQVVPHTTVDGVRTPIPNYLYKMSLEKAGTTGYAGQFLPQYGDSFDLCVNFPIAGPAYTMRTQIEPVVTFTTRNSLDGVPYERISVYYFFETLPNGKNHSLTFHYDITDVDTAVSYLGFRYPLRRNGLKFTSELEGFSNLTNEYYQIPSSEQFPSVYYTIRLDFKGQWPYPVYILDPNSFPMRITANIPMDFPRIPGFPAWSEYPRGDRPQNRIPQNATLTRIGWEDPRVTVSFDFAAFSSSTYRFPWTGSNQTNEVPIYSSYAFFPTTEEYPRSLQRYLDSEEANNVRGTSMTIIYYAPRAESYGVGDTVIWDPDFLVLFSSPLPPEAQGPDVVAITVGVLVGGAFLVAALVVLAVPSIREKVFPFMSRGKESHNARLTTDNSQSAAADAHQSSLDEREWKQSRTPSQM